MPTRTTTGYTWKEMMAVFFARDLADGDRVCSGAHTEISFAATLLAQKTHAPNMRLQLGGTCFLVNVTGLPVELPTTSTDYRMLQWAEAAHDHPQTFEFFAPPGGHKYKDPASPFRRTNRYYVGDKFFAGGIQADRHGNANLIGIGPRDALRLRGPGTVGICDIVTVRDVYVFLTSHDPSRLVERVDYISIAGPKTWREHNFLGGGPKWIVTPKAVFDFDADGVARLKALFPGATLAEVRQNTGFDIGPANRVEEVPPPTAEELAVLREDVDPRGILRR